MKRTRHTFLLLLVALLFACGSDLRFNREGWKERGDLGQHVNRERMLDDLLDNHRLDGASQAEILELLGAPSGYDRDEMWYLVAVKVMNGDTNEVSNLVLFMDADSAILSHEVRKWHRR